MRTRSSSRPPLFVVSAAALLAVTVSAAGAGTGPEARAAVAAGSTAAATPSGPVPVPTVEGPVTGGVRTGGPFWATPIDLKQFGYVEEEDFLSGTASDRGLSGTEHSAPYKVRILVRRPADPARFNGSAVLEWFNVSLQQEVEHEWPIDFPMLMRDGYVSASVSAQFLGVQSTSPMSLKNWDPQRYGSLQHPGDDYSYDIFAQAAQALRSGLVTGHHPTRAPRASGTGARWAAPPCIRATSTRTPPASTASGARPRRTWRPDATPSGPPSPTSTAGPGTGRRSGPAASSSIR